MLKTEVNVFGAGDEITRLALESNALSTEDGTRLMLKANVFGALEMI